MAIERMAVVGAGQMGSGIAQVAAQAGISVTLVDAAPQLAEKALARLGARLQKLVEKGKMTAGDRGALALAARELRGPVLQPGAEPDPLEYGGRCREGAGHEHGHEERAHGDRGDERRPPERLDRPPDGVEKPVHG